MPRMRRLDFLQAVEDARGYRDIAIHSRIDFQRASLFWLEISLPG